MKLRYGMNPQQATASATPIVPGTEPVRVVHGQPSIINMLDALNAWQLVREATRLLDRPVAASFKHTSPAGAAVSGLLDEVAAGLYGADAGIGGVTSAYIRARDADPKSSYGDFAAVSHPVDGDLTDLLARVVCDGIIAPGYAPGTVARLSRKKKGHFLIMEADPAFTPPREESRDVFGVRLTQDRDTGELSRDLLAGAPLPEEAVDDLLLGMAVLRYTQSNSVCYIRDGMTLGIGAGQQSRVDCTRLAGVKADTWRLRRHPAVAALDFEPETRRQDRLNRQVRFIEEALAPDRKAEWLAGRNGISFVSDGYLPFRDNVDEARTHGVSYIAEPGGSVHSGEVAEACREHGIVLARTGLRLFHH